ncbi:hypothetical protein [Planctomycetes bacterium K23_9]|uniref:Secreted protein n=1 Tax=Stieleria marina TaxID=1930275 RepID=A0A517NMS3_9BACT|nr:hypothetical protein K239x_03690 [Planctomycetes bacterium K23_9]
MPHNAQQLSKAICMLFIGTVLANSLALGDPIRTDQVQDSEVAVSFFEAIDGEQIQVRFIPVDAFHGNILIHNQTDTPLTIQLPTAFAAVPVLAQLGGFGQGQQGFGQQAAGGGANQAVGGGVDQGGQAGGNNRNPGGFMRIAPDRPRKLKASTVCLEHGKPEPNPRIKYTIMPIDKYSSDERIAKLCSDLSQRKLPRNVAQAAAWRLANGLPWKEIASLNRMESKYLGNIRFFTAREIDQAKEFVDSFDQPTSERELTATR